jgi:arylsulfatase A-like enzyme
MLLSGRAYFRLNKGLAEADKPNFPTSLKKAGYVTYHHGKRGNTAPAVQALFDHNHYLKNDDAERRSGHPGKEIADAAIDFLKKDRGGKPFFLYLAFANPHDPRVASPDLLALYRRDDLPLPKNYRPLHPFDNGEMTVRDEKLAPWPRTEAEVRKHLHDYYAVITGVDRQIGRILQALRELKEYDNTIIVFSSDHGLAVGSHGLMGKQNLYEAGMKVPLMVAGPGIPKGHSEALVYLLDIFPTVCDLVGTEVPAELDGQSLRPVLEGKSKGVRDSLFLAYRDVQRAVRDDRWKLIRYPHINKTQLFDLQKDPDEVRNLAAAPEQKERVRQLLGKMAEWQKRLGDAAPLSSKEPRDPKWTPPPTSSSPSPAASGSG